MGNCPSGFTPIGFQCVVTCPDTDNLTNRVVDGESRCVYTSDATKFFALKTAPSISLNPGDPAPTLEWVRVNRAAQYPGLKAAFDDFTNKRAALLSTISKDQQIATSFQALQTAENNRAQNPEAYQAARTAYYTLTKGQDWLASERSRLLNAEVLPAVSSYIQSINDITERKAQQDTTKAVIGSVQTKLISLKDDFRATTTTLMKQVDVLKNQIELEKRRAVVQQQQTYDWLVNLLLVAVSVIVIVILVRKVFFAAPKRPAYTPPSPTR